MNKIPVVGIIDYGLGNLYSVQKACSYVGFETKLIADFGSFSGLDALILPGVGAFGDAIFRLSEKRLIEEIRNKVESGIPILGICLGMQLLMSSSEEFGHHKGLNLIQGKVVKFEKEKYESQKIPQIQWNKIKLSNNNSLFENILNDTFFYFLHSFYVIPDDPNVISASTEYKGIDYCCAFQKNNIFGTQFHPEKSGKQGIQIFQNFKNYIINGK